MSDETNTMRKRWESDEKLNEYTSANGRKLTTRKINKDIAHILARRFMAKMIAEHTEPYLDKIRSKASVFLSFLVKEKYHVSMQHLRSMPKGFFQNTKSLSAKSGMENRNGTSVKYMVALNEHPVPYNLNIGDGAWGYLEECCENNVRSALELQKALDDFKEYTTKFKAIKKALVAEFLNAGTYKKLAASRPEIEAFYTENAYQLPKILPIATVSADELIAKL